MATQNDTDGHETDRSPPSPSISVGALHELPLKVTVLPSSSTAVQSDADEHETEVSVPLSMPRVGALHELPL